MFGDVSSEKVGVEIERDYAGSVEVVCGQRAEYTRGNGAEVERHVERVHAIDVEHEVSSNIEVLFDGCGGNVEYNGGVVSNVLDVELGDEDGARLGTVCDGGREESVFMGRDDRDREEKNGESARPGGDGDQHHFCGQSVRNGVRTVCPLCVALYEAWRGAWCYARYCSCALFFIRRGYAERLFAKRGQQRPLLDFRRVETTSSTRPR